MTLKAVSAFLWLTIAPGCSSLGAGEFGDLTRIARGKTDKADNHGFAEIYDQIFSHLRNSPIRLCEIGIAGGGSLKTWSEYFSRGTVFGIDIFSLSELRKRLTETKQSTEYLPARAETPRVKTFVADQTRRDQLDLFIRKYGGDFDIVLDDGGHSMEMQQVSFGFFFKYVKPGGYYVIEDVHTSRPEQYPDFGAWKDERNTTLTMIQSLIRHGNVQSRYLHPDEIRYLNSQVEFCNLFYRNNGARSITCIFRKRETQKK